MVILSGRRAAQLDTNCSGEGERGESGRSLLYLQPWKPHHAGKLPGEGQALDSTWYLLNHVPSSFTYSFSQLIHVNKCSKLVAASQLT